MEQNFLKIVYHPFKTKAIYPFREDVVKLYQRMYQLAENIVIHEMRKFESKLRLNKRYKKVTLKGKYDNEEIILEKISNYRDERLKYHMEQMKEILYKYLEAEKEKQSRAGRDR
ncbi:MAG: hypothetical protein DRN05_04565 [Thermoplasmata archaeon]|nr:MAG: hypothetical protein DRN05_04565 [Thermoplasmata archaeon]